MKTVYSFNIWHLSRGILTNVQLSTGSKNFMTVMKALKMRMVECIFLWLTTTTNHVRPIIETDLHKTTWDVTEELNFNHLIIVQNLHQIGKIKKIRTNSWTKNKIFAIFICYKINLFFDHISIYEHKFILKSNRQCSMQWWSTKTLSQTKVD